jgi:tetratricopeptide (TPR) repeat protein
MMLHKKILEKLKVRPAAEPDEDYCHYESGLELTRQTRHAEALIEFKRALRSGERVAETHLAVGLLYEHLGQQDNAIRSFTEAVKVDSRLVEGYVKLGLAYDCSGQFLKAIGMHLKAIRLSPDDVELRRNLARAYFNVGSYAEAIKAYEQALQINPDDAATHHGLGLVYLDLDDREAALEQHQLIDKATDAELADQLMDEIDRQSLRRPKPDTNKQADETSEAWDHLPAGF